MTEVEQPIAAGEGTSDASSAEAALTVGPCWSPHGLRTMQSLLVERQIGLDAEYRRLCTQIRQLGLMLCENYDDYDVVLYTFTKSARHHTRSTRDRQTFADHAPEMAEILSRYVRPDGTVWIFGWNCLPDIRRWTRSLREAGVAVPELVVYDYRRVWLSLKVLPHGKGRLQDMAIWAGVNPDDFDLHDAREDVRLLHACTPHLLSAADDLGMCWEQMIERVGPKPPRASASPERAKPRWRGPRVQPQGNQLLLFA
jgi:hypothetical protein